ncbi:MAG: 1-acyl-sn-glycerol-3-phosphate acyltransferase [Bacteroidales bacterium]|jgi:1-acyl-sn-glycerol-3-phosphate acyltransferase|nr:1-acyl-sn-glycerol-3-phosphate acyltransferase [Bacteroidales bacterium]
MELDLGKPERFSLAYFLLRHTWFRLLFHSWYKRVQVVGAHHVYEHKSTILAINHQNTAMDALVVLGALPKPVLWLARADMFKSNVARPVLQWLKIMPIFRQRDGLKALANNEKVFEKCVDVLAQSTTLALFPEATHWGFRRLRETKKAVPRIAFLAEEQHNFSLDVHIVPTGIYYENYFDPRSDLLIHFGKPIAVAQFKHEYEKNPQQAQQDLKDLLDDAMKAQMIAIQHFDAEYDAYETLRYVCAGAARERLSLSGVSLQSQFAAHKKVIEVLDTAKEEQPEVFAEIITQAQDYKRNLAQQNYTDEVVKKNGSAWSVAWRLIVLLLTMPIFMVGAVLHGYLYCAVTALARKAAKDKQFRSTVAFGALFLLMPIIYIVYALLWLRVANMPLWSLVPFWVGIYLAAWWSFDYAACAKKTFKLILFNLRCAKNNISVCGLVKQRMKIIGLFGAM